jgi:hypothetical protein
VLILLNVRIENPTRGGARFTSPARASLYVSQGCAKLSPDGERLRFIESHHRKKSAELSAQEMADQEHRLTANGYDGRTGVLTLDEIAHLPAIRPVVLATIPKKIRRPSFRNGPVKFLMRNGIPAHRAQVVSINSVRSVRKVRENAQAPKAA